MSKSSAKRVTDPAARRSPRHPRDRAARAPWTTNGGSTYRWRIINGEVANPHAVTDAQPILMRAGYYWCIGSYYFDSGGGGGYWDGVIYAPIWFSRVLSPADIKAIHDQPCSP